MELVLAAAATAAVLACSVLLVLGCVCHLFKKGFTSFEDDIEGGRNLSMRPNYDNPDASDVTFEPLPDILAKTVCSRALRPRISCCDPDKQALAAKLVTVYQPFPRNQLLYIKEIGEGWFGQVLEGNAENIIPDSRFAKVVIRILKDDATSNEKALFLAEIAPFRDLEHANILRLLGQCTETSPFLAILEFPPLGDLKSYLLTQQKGPFIQFAIDVAEGLSYMHKKCYVHHDFAARNCMLMSDLQVKIGDYGIGEDLFREDYYDTGRDMLPIRWMSPESLELKQGVWQPKGFTYQSNVWSLSVLLWEILAVGRSPYTSLRDEEVLQKVIRDGLTKLPPPNSTIPLHERWYEIMEMCWQEADDRPSVDDILAFLYQIKEEVTSQYGALEQEWSSNTAAGKGQESTFMVNVNQSNMHVAEVLVHRVEESDNKAAFKDDFLESVHIRQNEGSAGFEDDFVSDGTEGLTESANLPQNDSILAYGGNHSSPDEFIEPEKSRDNLLSDPNILISLVPMETSTPSKDTVPVNSNQSENYDAVTSNHSTYITGSNENLHGSAFNSFFVTANSQNLSASNSEFVRPSHVEKKKFKPFSDISDKHIIDEGYRTAINIVNGSQFHLGQNSDQLCSEITESDSSPKLTDPETEKAKEIYMSKGAAIPPSHIHISRSLNTIPEDGIPSDNTSQNEVVFDSPESEDIGMSFEWDDYEGEQLVGQVRYSSDDSNVRLRQVEVEEWPFDQESSSESHSKSGSLASGSDTEVTGLSIGSVSSINTRARIASILTNRLNALSKQINPSHNSGQSSFYSFSQYDNDMNSSEHAFTEMDHPVDQASNDLDFSSDEGTSSGEETNDVTLQHEKNDDQINDDLEKIAQSVLRNSDMSEEIVSEPQGLALSKTTQDVIA